MSKEATPPRGTRDILPAEAALRDAVTAKILDTYRLYGFDRMETPAIEALSRLERSEGGDNTKLIFKIMKRGEKLEDAQATSPDALADLGLRFDLTVPLARYYANNRDLLPATFKAVQIGPVWRAERPQKGRFRQFVQCDLDVFGSAAFLVESELLIACGYALHSVGLTGFTIRLNDRRILAAIARDAAIPDDRFNSFCVTVDKADKIGMPGVYEELRTTGIASESVARLETLFTRLAEAESAAAAPGPQELRGLLQDPVNLPQSTADDLASIKTLVESQLAGKGSIAYDFTLVRGMGYYSGPIFEFGFRDYAYSIAGGGRYDGMVRNPSGTPVPACGLSIGFERIITILQDLGSDLGTPGNKVAILITPATPLAAALALQQNYIAASVPAAILYKAKNFTHQLDQLAAAKFREFVTVDDTGHPTPAKSLVRDDLGEILLNQRQERDTPRKPS